MEGPRIADVQRIQVLAVTLAEYAGIIQQQQHMIEEQAEKIAKLEQMLVKGVKHNAAAATGRSPCRGAESSVGDISAGAPGSAGIYQQP